MVSHERVKQQNAFAVLTSYSVGMLMRPPAIQVPGLDSLMDSFRRLKQFARMILAVPREEADKESESAANDKRVNGTKQQDGSKKEREPKTEGGSPVSEKLLKNLRELTRSIEENTPRVKDSMTKSGRCEPDGAVVSSAAKYHGALEKLAKE